MKVILARDIPKLGNRGAVVEVAEGYARNYLIPRGLAVEATDGRLKELSNEKRRQDQKQKQELEDAKRLAARLEGKTVEVITRAGEKGKLFGSVTNKELSQSIKNSFHIDVDRRKIDVKEPIKALGNYEITIRLHPEVHTRLHVKVIPEENR